MGLWDVVFSSRSRPRQSSRQNRSDNTDDGQEENKSVPIGRDPLLDGWRPWIAYRDSADAYSERWVRVFRVLPSHLIGHCELRRSQRTFRLDRIIELSDPRSGGVIENPFDYFEPFFEKVTESHASAKQDGFGRALKVIEAIGDELRVLTFVAEIDGRFGAAEMNIILKVAEILTKDAGLSLTKRDLSNLKKWLKLQDPDEAALRSAVQRIANRRQLSFTDLWELAEIVSGIDGKIHERERDAIKVLREAMEAEFASAAETVH